MHSFVLSGFADEIDSDFNVQLSELKRLNIANIELRGVNGKNITQHTIEEVKGLKLMLDQQGISVSAIGSPIGKINIKDDFEPHFELFKHTVAIAKTLASKYIRLFSFFMDHSEIETYREEVLRRMKAFCAYVEGTDIILLHENEKDIYGDEPERCLDILETMHSDHLKLIFDPANFVQCNVETYPFAFDLLKEHVVYYHIKDALMVDASVVPSGYGDGHIKEIISQLVQRDFQGYLSLEPHLGFFTGFSDLETSRIQREIKDEVIDTATSTGKSVIHSDAQKFELAVNSLKKIIQEVENE